MKRSWTFSHKLAAAFLALGVLTAGIAVAAVVTVHHVSRAKDEVLDRFAQNLVDAEKLHSLSAGKAAESRAYFLSRDKEVLGRVSAERQQFAATLAVLSERVVTPESHRALADIQRAEQAHQDALEPIFAMVASGASTEDVGRAYEKTVWPQRTRLDQLVDGFVARERTLLKQHRDAADAAAARGVTLLVGLALALGVLAVVAALVLARTLGRQISTAVQQVRSSSAELQSAAGQQATGARQQATAVSEISTTISELLTTSRQIAESAKRVAHIANDTAGAARAGNSSVERSQDAVAAIRRQVELIVGHMLELGRKSQQIGGILDIINELSEQTNILAINASIEAAGAGELGRRFGVVADEIRKLADRVGGSTKDVRGLIDEIRAAVNTTVMATESGSKAVETGARQFDELTAGFRQIGELVITTTQAATEIELSTKQQATAVEQVNVAIGNVAQATREAEASATQSAQTAAELAGMSRDLSRLVRAEGSA
jgi:methyl-accepting chemotaxis protein